MFPEKQLRHEFNKKAQELQTPQELDQQIYQRIKKEPGHYLEKGKSEKGSRRMGSGLAVLLQPFPRTVIIAVALLLFSGFVISYEKSQKQISQFYVNKLPIKVTYAGARGYELPDESLGMLKKIRDQLEPGEAAVVYAPELKPEDNSYIRYTPYRKVNHLIEYTDIPSWLSAIGPDFKSLRVPSLLPKGFSLKSGTIESEFFGSLGDGETEAKRLLEQREDLKSGDWEKVKNQVIKPSLTFKNEKNEEIVMRASFHENIRDFEITYFESTSTELIYINGYEGVYSYHYSWMRNTGFKSISWFETQDEGFFWYDISSGSPKITLKDLLLIAENME